MTFAEIWKTFHLTMIVRTAVIVIVTIILLRVINRVFRDVIKNKERLHFRFLKSVLKFLLILVAAYSVLSQFTFAEKISTTLLQSGTLIVAVATFAAQQSLGNLISGFSISASRPCDIGQRIKIVQGATVLADGIVRDMTMRHVVIEQLDGKTCVVPNSLVDSSVIVNTNYVEDIGTVLEVEVGYQTDIDLAKKILTDICLAEPSLVHPEKTSVFVSMLTANGMTLRFTVWTKTVEEGFAVGSHIRQRIVERFAEAGIVIPYQTVTIDQSGSENKKPDDGEKTEDGPVEK